jgi:uncharacterized repeat protein (TIGR01451 family)
MRRGLLMVVVLLAAAFMMVATGRAMTDDGDGTVRINGTAYRATEPTGPDFSGVTLIPFQAHNPSVEAWEATQAQNERYLRPEEIPANVQVSHSGLYTYASHYLNDFSEVMVAIDPTDPDHLLGCSKFFYTPQTYDFYTGVFESYDGGATWSQFQPDGVEAYTMTSDPVTTFDDVGNGYFTLLTRGPTGVDMLKKPVGVGWELPVVVDRTTYTDKQWIMGDQDPQGISPYAGYLYMSWTSIGADQIVVSRSTDSNGSWSAPLAVASYNIQGSIPGVAPDGTVYVVFGRNIFDGQPGALEFVKSADGGASFTTAAVAANIIPIPYELPNSDFRSPASLPAFAVSPVDGALYLAWADYRNADADIYFTSSTDGGATWSPQQRLNDDPLANGIDQFQPQVSVAPNGRVAVMWFDRRLACPDLPWIPPDHVGNENFCIDTFMTRSTDGGASWAPNIRASAQTWDWSLNLPNTGITGFIGDYQGIASSDEADFPFWNATANLGENVENYQEVFVARVPMTNQNLGPSTKTVDPQTVVPGGTLTYTMTLENAGTDPAAGARMTDTIPLSTTYVAGSLTYPEGTGGYNAATGVITWTGTVSPGVQLPIAFQVTVDPALEGSAITNTALIDDGAGTLLERTVVAALNLPPRILATAPADGALDVIVEASLVITFSEPMMTATLAYTVTPDPGGWMESWSAGDTLLTLVHAPFAAGQGYTATVAAEDLAGLALVPGPVPNPWSFVTASPPPPIRLFLPVVMRNS